MLACRVSRCLVEGLRCFCNCLLTFPLGKVCPAPGGHSPAAWPGGEQTQRVRRADWQLSSTSAVKRGKNGSVYTKLLTPILCLSMKRPPTCPTRHRSSRLQNTVLIILLQSFKKGVVKTIPHPSVR